MWQGDTRKSRVNDLNQNPNPHLLKTHILMASSCLALLLVLSDVHVVMKLDPFPSPPSHTRTHARKHAALRWYNAVITMEICWRWTLSGQCQECPPVSLHLQIWFQPWELLRAREDGSLQKRPRQAFKSQIQGQNLWEMLACTLN